MATFDFFGDGSAVELIDFNANLNTTSHGSLSMVSPTFAPSVMGYEVVTSTTDTAILPTPSFYSVGDNKTPGAISLRFTLPPSSNNNDGGIVFLYEDTVFGAVYVYLDLSDLQNIDFSIQVPKHVGLPYVENVPYCIVVSWDSDGLARVYSDGVLIDEKSYSNGRDPLGMNELWIGGKNIGPGDDYRVSCRFDQVRFFSRGLTASEAGLLYNEPFLANGLLDQASSVEEYWDGVLTQGSSLESNGVTMVEQKSSVLDYVSSVFSQESSLSPLSEVLFNQVSSVPPVGSVGVGFTQVSSVNQYQPYKDMVNEESFWTLPDAENTRVFSTFNDSVYLVGTTEYNKKVGNINFAPAVFGRGYSFDGQSYLLESMWFSGFTYCLSGWLILDDDSFNGDQTFYQYIEEVGKEFYISSNDNEVVFTRLYPYEPDMVFVIEKKKVIGKALFFAHGRRDRGIMDNAHPNAEEFLFVDKEIVYTAVNRDNLGIGNLVIGALNTDKQNPNAVTNIAKSGVVDQLRSMDDMSLRGATNEMLTDLSWESKSQEWLKNDSSIGGYTTVMFEQSSECTVPVKHIFSQDSSLLGNSFEVFVQQSSVLTWSAFRTFTQMSSVLRTPRATVIRRVG